MPWLIKRFVNKNPLWKSQAQNCMLFHEECRKYFESVVITNRNAHSNNMGTTELHRVWEGCRTQRP